MNWLAAAPTLLPLILAGFTGLGLAIAAWPRRDAPGGRIAILNATAVALFWCGALAAQLVASDLATKLLWQKVRFLGAAIVPPLFLLQVLTCTGRRAWITRRRVAVLAVVPVLATAAAWTSEWHTLAFHHLRLVPAGPLMQLGHDAGLALRGYLAFAVACTAVAAVLLLDTVASGIPRYRAQAAVLLVAAAIPWLSRLVPGAGRGLVLAAGVHPLAFIAAAMLSWVAVFRLGLFDLVPIARGTVIDGMADALVVLDRRGRIVDLNPAAQRLFGGGIGQAVGQSARQALGAWPAWDALAPLVEGARGGPADAPVELAIGDRVLEATSTALEPAPDGSAEGRMVLLRDVTDRVRAHADLAAAKREAEAASAAKGEFLARMSHEVRTPLNGILGLCELLLQDPLDEDQRRRAAALQRSGHVLLAVLADVLDAARLEAGRLELSGESFDPRQVVEDVVELFTRDARAKGLALHALVDGGVPSAVQGDAARLHQALSNLVSNAVKFTDAGRVTVALDAAAAGPGSWLLRFEVRDTGPGVAAEAQPRLFQPFTQAEPFTARRYGGSGLGLSICRQLATLMGGQAGMTSVAGRGSTFWFSARVETGALSPSAQERGTRFAGRVLLADDHPLNRRILRELLERRGCSVDEAAGGREALERATAGEPYDLVLLDLQMPDLDGRAVAAAIRGREGVLRRTPLVALTAGALPGDRELSLSAGLDDHLVKPLAGTALVSLLERFLAHAPGSAPAEGRAAEPREPGVPDLLERYLEDARSSLDELRASLTAGDAERLRREVHRFKGSSLFLGATRLADLCERLRPAGAAADGADALHEMERELARLEAAPRVAR